MQYYVTKFLEKKFIYLLAITQKNIDWALDLHWSQLDSEKQINVKYLFLQKTHRLRKGVKQWQKINNIINVLNCRVLFKVPRKHKWGIIKSSWRRWKWGELWKYDFEVVLRHQEFVEKWRRNHKSIVLDLFFLSFVNDNQHDDWHKDRVPCVST